MIAATAETVEEVGQSILMECSCDQQTYGYGQQYGHSHR